MAGYIKNYIKRTNKSIWAASVAISLLSLILLKGILDSGYSQTLGLTQRNVLMQGIALLLGIVSAAVISQLDYNEIAKNWKIYLPLNYLLMLATFVVGVGASGRPDDKRWLNIPIIGFSFQPSELFRLAFILGFAYHIQLVYKKINTPQVLVKLLFHGAVPAALLHLQGDDGSALIIAAVMVGMLFIAGLSWKYIMAGVSFLAVSLPLIWAFVLNEFQKQRILAIYSSNAQNSKEFYYQQYQASLAIGSGGLAGKGIWGVEHVYVPKMQNDFIFSFLCESLGFIGSVAVLALLLFMWVKILLVVLKNEDILGKTICTGVLIALAFQTLLNIGMNISLFPVVGNPFPLLSCGGSSVLTSYMGIGLILSVHMRSKQDIFK